jgi:hypothetical protein
VSEQQAEHIQGEAGSAGAGEAAPKVSVSGKPFGTTGPAATVMESPRIAPDQEETTPRPDASKIEAVKVEPAKADAPKIEAVKVEPPRIGALKPEVPRFEAAKSEAPKSEAPKSEAPKSEAPKSEAPKSEAAKFEALKAEAPKIEVARAEAPKMAEAPKTEAPKVEVAKAEAPMAEVAKAEAVKAEAAKVEASRAASGKVEAPKVDTSKAGAVKPEVRRFPAKPTTLTMMSQPSDRSSDKKGGDAKAESGPVSPAPVKRRFTAIAAVLALAAITGALGGALATAGLTHFTGQGTVDAAGSAADPALEAWVARIDADILALKAGLEETSKTGASQFNQTGDRLDKIEQTLAEPAGNKLAKFSDAVDKLSTTPPAAANAMAAAPREPKDVTGSVTRQVVASAAPAPAPGAPPKPQVGRLPTLDGWVLRDVRRGGALIEGRAGLYEVYAGDPVPGLGKVDAIRKQDGRWVVVTTKGLVVAR